jgi:hypothetical protein
MVQRGSEHTWKLYGLQRKNSLHRQEKSWNIECVEEYLGGDITITPWIERCFGQENWVLSGMLSERLCMHR